MARVDLTNLILRAAWEGRWGKAQDADVTMPELCVRAYGWDAGGPLRDDQNLPVSGRRFAHIPTAVRDRAYASLSRAIRRLEARGWIEVQRYRYGAGRLGVKLTDAGWAWTAQRLHMPNIKPPVTGTALVPHWTRGLKHMSEGQADLAKEQLAGAMKPAPDGSQLSYTLQDILQQLNAWPRTLATCTPEQRQYLATRLQALIEGSLADRG